ncbi:MAG: hypothetical protein JST68_21165 [Bacteroidetes bacterium]|nr:hypothetical protein [Bacteroidota bacterium]
MQDEQENLEEIAKKYRAMIDDPRNKSPYENDPFFKKKLEDAYKALEETPLPEHIMKRVIKY